MSECRIPPPGWRCTRPDPHDGPCAAIPTMGYHMVEIRKGVLGELSKVQEELDELKDAELQGVRVMQLVEASDLIGALVCWLKAHHPGTTLDDLIEMSEVTRRAFASGVRKSSPTPDDEAAMAERIKNRRFERGATDAKVGLPPTEASAEYQRGYEAGARAVENLCGNGCFYERGHSGRCSDDPAHP